MASRSARSKKKKRPNKRKRAFKKLLLEFPDYDEAFRVFNERFHQERSSCKTINFRHWVKAAKIAMKPIIQFFVSDVYEYNRQFHIIRADLKLYAKSKYRLPWPLHAYKGMKDDSLPDRHEPLRNIQRWPQVLKMIEECRKCKSDKCQIRIPISIAMLLAVDAFTPQDWNDYCDKRESMDNRTGYDYSHLHALNWCVNPLNGDWDRRWVNTGPRKICHNKAFSTTDDFCGLHEKTPCYLRGARMVQNSQKIARKMIRLHRKSRLGIEAYEYYECG